MSRPLTLYLVAGEPSGDELGAALMRALRGEVPEIRFLGIGGPRMAREGLVSLFDMGELSVMGLAEVVPRIPALARRLRETVANVVAAAPDALVTIDSPGFCLRVAARVRARAPAIRTIHYVAPSVWAWRPGRARRMARFIDHVLALLPFEPAYMTVAGMTCEFVGHPAALAPVFTDAELAAFRARAGAEGEGPLLLIAPGSRAGEVRRLMPIFAETVARAAADLPGLRTVIPLVDGMEAEVELVAARISPGPLLVRPEEGDVARRTAFAAADAGLAKSGTVALELAAAGTPMLSAYRTSWTTAALLRRMLRVDTANLVNLVGGERVVPEFIQEDCAASRIVPALRHLLADAEARNAQRRAFERVVAALGGGGEPPSCRAARSVLKVLG